MKLDAPSQGGGRILDVNGQGVGGLENWIIFMDFICLSFIRTLNFLFFFGRFNWKKRAENAIYRYSYLLMKSKSAKLHFIKQNLFAEKRNT